MALKKGGLGKGLEALFNQNIIPEESEVIRTGEMVENLNILEVEPNKNQPRRQFDDETLHELAESIKMHGVIQPIIVVKKDDYYKIVAGERRWRASKLAGLSTIPAIVRDLDERKNKEIALIENVQREDLNPIDKAKGIKALMQDYELTQQEVADILGKSRSGIANTVRILNLDERVIKLVYEGKLDEGHCKSLLSFPEQEEQYKIALKIIETGGSVRDIERKLRIKNKVDTVKKKKYEAVYKDIESTFQSFFGSKVKLDPGKRRGRIIIEYNNNEDLERLIELIK